MIKYSRSEPGDIMSGFYVPFSDRLYLSKECLYMCYISFEVQTSNCKYITSELEEVYTKGAFLVYLVVGDIVYLKINQHGANQLEIICEP